MLSPSAHGETVIDTGAVSQRHLSMRTAELYKELLSSLWVCGSNETVTHKLSRSSL